MGLSQATPVWRIIYEYGLRHRLGLGCMILAVTLATVAAMSESYILKLILDHVSGSSDDDTLSQVFVLIGILLGAYFLQNALFRTSGFIGIRVLPTIRTEFRADLFSHLRGHSQRFFSDHFSGSLATKISQAGRALGNLYADFLWNVYVAICVGVIGLALLATIAPSIVVIEVILLGVYLTAAMKFIRGGLPYHKAYADARSKTTGQLADTIGNILSVITFAAQRREQKHIQDVCLAENDKHRASWRYQEYVRVFNDFATDAIVIIMMVVGVVYWSKGVATVGDIAMIFTLTASLGHQVRMVSQQMLNISEQFGDIRDALEIIGVEHDIKDRANAARIEAVHGTIAYEDVSFVYPESGEHLFEHLDVHVDKGERVALVGPSGSGKTTFMRLLLRMYDPTNGSIRIDGKDIRSFTQESLRDHIAVVSQEPSLFHRTLRDNIAYGKPNASFEEVVEAAKRAHIHEFITSLPEGYDTYVGERGVKLSGGQKQRVAIARAILKDAPILLFDEATSSLDSESEHLIQEALEPLMHERTVIAIAHRLSTIRHFDRILVFKNGCVVEDGDHRSLIDHGGVYANLWHRQSDSFQRIPDHCSAVT